MSPTPNQQAIPSHDDLGTRIALTVIIGLTLIAGVIVAAAVGTAKIFGIAIESLRGKGLGRFAVQLARHPLRPFGVHTTPLVLAVWWLLAALGIAGLVLLAIALKRVAGADASRDRGYASDKDIAARASVQAAKQRRRQTRPDLNHKGEDRDFGYPLGKVLPQGRKTLFASHEASMQLVGPPGCGKTAGVLVPIIRDHIGPVLATSTKADIYELTAMRRRALGGPIAVLDPEQMLVGAPSLRWSPVRGCENTRTAERRAAALIAGGIGEAQVADSSAFFNASATSTLAAFLHAAALVDEPIGRVLDFCRGAYQDAITILDSHGDPLVNYAARLRQHTTGAEITTSGVLRSVELALSCFGHREVLDQCSPSVEETFDIAEHLKANGTVYLLGVGDKNNRSAALTTAFAEEFMFVAGNVIAPHQSGHRLSPPLLACLDEAPSIAPLPSLPRLLADGRGRGIVVIAAMQSFSQVRSRWGVNDAETINNAATITSVFGGLSAPEDLRALSMLAGTRSVLAHSSHGGRGTSQGITTHWQEEAVLRPDEIRTLPSGHMLVFFDTLQPVIVRVRSVYETDGDGVGRERQALEEVV